MAEQKFHIYVKRLANGEVVEKIEVQERNLHPGLLDKIVTGLMRHMDLDRFCVDDDVVQKEALRRATKKGKT